MSTARPPSRRQAAHQRAIDDALSLITTARTDPGDGALVEHAVRVVDQLQRPGDPTGSQARLARLVTTLAFAAGYALEQWLTTDPTAAQAWLASLAVHSGQGVAPWR